MSRRAEQTRIVCVDFLDAVSACCGLYNGISNLLTFNAVDFKRYPKITLLAPTDVE